MPRLLSLVIFLAFCSVAFMAGNLFAGELDSKGTPTQKLKPRDLTPGDNHLASILKAAHKKSSTESRLGSKKKTASLKSTYHKPKSSKKLKAHKPTFSKKHTYSKSKLHKKPAYRKAKAKTAKSSFYRKAKKY